MSTNLKYTLLNHQPASPKHSGYNLGQAYSNSPMLAWMGPPNEKDEVKLITQTYICKAYLHDAVQDHKAGRYTGDISFDRTRLITYLSGVMGKYSEEALDELAAKAELFKRQTVKITNLYEQLAKWKRTRVVDLTPSKDVISGMTNRGYKYDEKRNLFYKDAGKYGEEGTWAAIIGFQGSAKWMATPHTISMYTLLIRTSHVDYGEFETLDDLIEKWTKYFHKGNLSFSNSDVTYMRKAINRMHLFIKHRKEIYKDRTDKSIWSICKHSTGIADLCDFNDTDTKANAAFKRAIGG